MPRRSVADTAKTHDRIIRHASRVFRSRGSAVGISDVMKEIGLTQGGFYRHFESKEDLFVAAVTASFQQLGDRLEAIAQAAPAGKAAAAIIEAYLSMEHVRHPETWCVLASLAAEIARMPASTRKQIDAASMRYMERMAKYMNGENATERRHKFILLFAGMAGSIALVRSLGDASMKEQAIALSRSHYLQVFG